MTRAEPDIAVVNRTLSVTVQKQEAELAHLRGAMSCAIQQISGGLHLAARQTLTVALERDAAS